MQVKRILFINFGGLGDEILFLPTIQSVKKEFPNSQITLALEERSKGITTLEITLYQGLNRQIRKMFASFGFKVLSLKRISHATITLTGLKRGDCKVIKPKQIKQLKDYIEKIKKMG